MPYADPEKARAYHRKWREDHPHHGREWRATHPHYSTEYMRKWRASHPTYFRDMQRRINGVLGPTAFEMFKIETESPYRNGFELKLAEQLDKAGIEFGYETLKLQVNYPPRTGRYTPDLIPKNSNIVIEGKGFFYGKAADRQKLILVKEQHPELDIRLVFQNASTKIYKGSKTTYGKWAEDHGFKWSDRGVIPQQWLYEIKEQQRGKTGADKLARDRAGSRTAKRSRVDIRGRE